MPNQVHPVQQLLIAMDVLPLDGEHFSNNNNQNTLWQLRDRLFQVLFERATIAYAATIHPRIRKLVEYVILTSAVISLLVLIYLHIGFVRTPVNCLDEVSKIWSREGVLRIELSLEEPSKKAFNISRFYNTSLASHLTRIQQEHKNNVAATSEKSDIKPVNKEQEIEEESATIDVLDAEKSPVFINRTVPFKDSVSDPDCFTPMKATVSEEEMFSNTAWPQEQYIIEYSLEYGYLRLSSGARQNSTVKVHTVTLDPNKDQCFGNDLSRFVLKYFVGYSDLLMGSLRNLVDKDENKGFVRNVVTGDQYRFVDKSTNWTAYFSAAFFMMVFTLSVSMLLRYSHHQIFLFVVELLHVFEMNTVSFPAAPLLTVVLALVGMEAIMSEFFNDSVTAFYIIIIVWMADQYDSICCRTALSKRHWLRLFYLYHFGFYAYHYRFNGQYSFLALSTSWLFTQHSMIYFFHHYELPSVWRANMDEAEYDSDASYQTDNTRSSSALNQVDNTRASNVSQHGDGPMELGGSHAENTLASHASIPEEEHEVQNSESQSSNIDLNMGDNTAHADSSAPSNDASSSSLNDRIKVVVKRNGSASNKGSSSLLVS